MPSADEQSRDSEIKGNKKSRNLHSVRKNKYLCVNIATNQGINQAKIRIYGSGVEKKDKICPAKWRINPWIIVSGASKENLPILRVFFCACLPGENPVVNRQMAIVRCVFRADRRKKPGREQIIHQILFRTSIFLTECRFR